MHHCPFIKESLGNSHSATVEVTLHSFTISRRAPGLNLKGSCQLCIIHIFSIYLLHIFNKLLKIRRQSLKIKLLYIYSREGAIADISILLSRTLGRVLINTVHVVYPPSTAGCSFYIQSQGQCVDCATTALLFNGNVIL